MLPLYLSTKRSLRIETLKEKGIELDRAVLEEKAYNWFPSFETRAWFVRTLMGLLSAFTLVKT